MASSQEEKGGYKKKFNPCSSQTILVDPNLVGYSQHAVATTSKQVTPTPTMIISLVSPSQNPKVPKSMLITNNLKLSLKVASLPSWKWQFPLLRTFLYLPHKSSSSTTFTGGRCDLVLIRIN